MSYSPPVKNYGRWIHAGAGDPTSGAFDYTADLSSSQGSSIEVDSSSGWVTSWGYAVPTVTEDGSYSIVLKVNASAAGGTCGAAFYAADGTAFNTAIPAASAAIADDGTGTVSGFWSVTAHLPVGTHIDTAIGGNTVNADLFIQRIA